MSTFPQRLEDNLTAESNFMPVWPKVPLTPEVKYRVLVEISHKLRDTLDLNEILNHLLDTLFQLTHFDAAGIFVLNRDIDIFYRSGQRPRTMIAGIAQRGFDPAPVDRDRMLTRGEGLVGYVIQSGQSVVVPDVRADRRYVVGRRGTLSEITIPILLNDHIIGALNLESDRLAAFNENDLELLRFFADAAAVSIDKAMLHKQLIAKDQTDRQLRMAQEVQSQLLPQGSPTIPGYEIAATCMPTFDIGGDYFDYIELAPGALGIALADVSGHGIPAALVMSAFRALLRTQARVQPDPAMVAQSINRTLPEFSGRGDFVTAIYGVLHTEPGRFVYANCGHPPPLYVGADGIARKLAQNGPALGIFDQAVFESGVHEFESGELMVMYTDGVTESFAPDDRTFGLERLIDVVQQNHRRGLPEIIDAVLQSVREFTETDGFLDDFTLVMIRRRASG